MAKRGRKASAMKSEHIKKGRKKGHSKGGHKKHSMLKK